MCLGSWKEKEVLEKRKSHKGGVAKHDIVLASPESRANFRWLLSYRCSMYQVWTVQVRILSVKAVFGRRLIYVLTKTIRCADKVEMQSFG